MKIRPATDADIAQLVELGRLAHAESPRYCGVKFSKKRAREFATMLVFFEWALVLVAEADGHVVGALMGVVAPHCFSSQLYASDIFFYVEPAHRGSTVGARLLREWERLLVADGRVKESALGISSEIGDIERTRKLYEKLGYRTAGYMMVKQHVQP